MVLSTSRMRLVAVPINSTRLSQSTVSAQHVMSQLLQHPVACVIIGISVTSVHAQLGNWTLDLYLREVW
jgi:Na+-translocating ferredoxin:NAD+ oxidoreductase RnfE subunit